ncbi:MAG: MFS transporter, partial [Acidobacteriota bacterium]
GAHGSLVLFVTLFSIIITMYGGGFATLPAYLADLFGIGHVSAIHGRLLTAWSTAGILGPVLVNYIREAQIARGVPAAQAYEITMYILAGFLVVGLLCNLAVRPVTERMFEQSAARAATRPAPASVPPAATAASGAASGQWLAVAMAWTFVLVPLAWGVYNTMALARRLFTA